MAHVTRVFVLLLLLLVPRLAAATTYTVCAGGCNYTSVNAAIDNAATVAGDVIEVQNGFHNEGIPIVIDKNNITIQGQGATVTTVQSAATIQTTSFSTFQISPGFTGTIKNMRIRHGWGPTNGGGVDNQGNVTLDGVIIERASASNGGGVANRGVGVMTIQNSIIRNNNAVSGTGVFNNAVLTVVDSTISGNSSVAIYNTSGGQLSVQRSTIAGNGGIGLYNVTGPTTAATFVNSTISGNQGGAGVHVADGVVRLSFCTVAGNSDETFTGGVFVSGSAALVELKNTLVTDNRLVEGNVIYPADCGGQGFDSYGHVLIGSLNDCPMSVYGTGDIFEEPAGLDFLRDNGGPTATHALLDGSPAIDGGDCTDLAGNPVTEDQRGVARPQNGTCDIGAYEFDGSAPTDKFACWDIDESDSCELVTEDQNGDGNCTTQDCKGEDGLPCWDLNGDRVCNVGSEDLNDDASCDLIDCRGSIGPQGDACWDLDTDGACDLGDDINDDQICNVEDCQGASGYSCWDLDEDYACDPGENTNMDGDCTPADCQGADGAPGLPGSNGTPGAACWDLNANSACNLPAEDPSGDNQCTLLDCRGAEGTSGYACWDSNQNHVCDPSEDETATDGCTVADCQGQDGYTCWDQNANYVCDPNEDPNNDNFCTVADCLGPIGPEGPTGVTCWDLNANQSCDTITEDLDESGACTLADCRGADGANGLDGYACWDLNANRICDESEDGNSDTQCNVLDCRGQDGADGMNGADGTDGVDGTDSLSALTRLSDEPAGGHCVTGGVLIESGIDDDGDGVLSDAEVDDSQYACNGLDGDTPTVVTGGDDGGCGCRAYGRAAARGWSALAVAFLFAWRRRRAGHARCKTS